MSNYNPISIPIDSPMTLTPLPSVETVTQAIIPILEVTEAFGNGGNVS